MSVLAPATFSGTVDLVSSSKAASLRRRQAARWRREKRSRKSSRVPQHTRAERKRAEAERQRQREAERSRQAWRRRGAVFALTSIGAAGFILLAPAQVSRGWHNSSLHVSAAGLAWPDRPEPPHPLEPDMTFYTSWAGPGTTATTQVVGPVDPVSWNGSERYGWWGPNILGD